MTNPAYNPTSSIKFYTYLTNNLRQYGYSTELRNLEFKPEAGHWYLTVRVSPQERYHGIVAFFVLGLDNVSAYGNRAVIEHRSIEFGTYIGDDPDLPADAMHTAELYLDHSIRHASSRATLFPGMDPGQCSAHAVASIIAGTMALAGLRTGVDNTAF